MKKSYFISITLSLLVSIFLLSCSSKDEIEQSVIVPQQKSANPDRNLRTLYPDLTIYAFSQYGGVSSDPTNYNIPFLCSEKNIGTAIAGGAGSDTLKVYQKVAVGTGLSTYYKYFFVDRFIRPSNIAIGSVYYFVASIKFPKSRRPASGKINLAIVADGGKKVVELNESNNESTTIWNIILP